MTRKNRKQKQRNRHVPLRTCIACRTKSPKKEMVRLAVDDSGALVLDPKGSVHGRGANLCLKMECFDKACEKGMFQRALRTKIDKVSIEAARESLESYLKMVSFRGGAEEKPVVHRVKKGDVEDKIGHAVTRVKVDNET